MSDADRDWGQDPFESLNDLDGAPKWTDKGFVYISRKDKHEAWLRRVDEVRSGLTPEEIDHWYEVASARLRDREKTWRD